MRNGELESVEREESRGLALRALVGKRQAHVSATDLSAASLQALAFDSYFDTYKGVVTHVRVFNEDREVSAWFLLDLSPSVDFGSGEVSKREVLTEFAAVVSRLLTRQGNRVGACCSSRYRYFESARAARDFLRGGGLGKIRTITCRGSL